LVAACSGNKVELPITTSIGNLVRIEKKQSVNTSDGVIEVGSQQVIYLLSFEGEKEFTYEGKDEPEGPKSLLLIDSRGNRFAPAFAGTPTPNGTISNEEWILNGEVRGREGKLVFVGTLSLPEPRVALVYLVPSNASRLVLKDGQRQHPIE
ncbi:hypothetical protein MYX77_11785, partial [Acidobacteriia bacterium AH_259_A11_L15]|nr:hypothetical protein [Acidobacteriia bacterium AH_259_A11_L15]